MDSVWNFELLITLFLQSLNPILTPVMEFFTFLGSEDFFMLVLPVVYWCLDARLGIRLAMLLILSNSFNHYAKSILRSPRPYWISAEVQPLTVESSFGMPSGHAMNSTTIWGLLATFPRRRWVWVVCILIILLVGLSRIYLGVHFTSDVLAGWLLGVLLLVTFFAVERRLSPWVLRLSLAQQVLLALITSLAFIAVSGLVLALVAAWQMPAAWQANATLADPDHPLNPLSLEGLLTSAGTWFGMLAGVAWLWRRGGYSAAGTPAQLAARYFLGLLGVAVLWYGLGKVFPRGEEILPLALRYLRYTLVGLWISAGAPLLYFRLGLAQPPQHQPQPAAPQPHPNPLN